MCAEIVGGVECHKRILNVPIAHFDVCTLGHNKSWLKIRKISRDMAISLWALEFGVPRRPRVDLNRPSFPDGFWGLNKPGVATFQKVARKMQNIFQK